MNQSMRANSKLDDSRCNDRDRSRIILDTSYIPHLDLEKCDQENVNLPSYVSIYAKEIFEYLQENNVVYFLNLMKFTFNSSTNISQKVVTCLLFKMISTKRCVEYLWIGWSMYISNSN